MWLEFILFSFNVYCAVGQMATGCQHMPTSCYDTVYCHGPPCCVSTDDVITSCVHPRHCTCVRNAPASGLPPLKQSTRSVTVRPYALSATRTTVRRLFLLQLNFHSNGNTAVTPSWPPFRHISNFSEPF